MLNQDVFKFCYPYSVYYFSGNNYCEQYSSSQSSRVLPVFAQQIDLFHYFNNGVKRGF